MFLKPVFALALLTAPVVAASPGAPVFGSVVAIGGSASDLALDESRGLLYVANMGASAVDVMSTADNTVRSSMNVLPFPGAIALSADSGIFSSPITAMRPPVPRHAPMPSRRSIWQTTRGKLSF